jgi:hypothetical protein
MRAYAKPLLVSAMGHDHQTSRPLEAMPMQAGSAGALYDERWLQLLIQAHPTLLPVDQIEPALVPAAPVCTELPLPSGYVDNLLMTADGGIVLVETKLWRNPDARRAVVGQVLDYAKDLSRWDYEQLQQAVRMARKEPNLQLYDHVCGPDAAAEGEAPFIDAVSRNLRLGRLLLLIVGDGVQENAEQLTDFLQRHIGLHFTLSLVELSLWRVPDTDQVFVQPRILARTVQLERAVVRIEDGGAESRLRIDPVAPNTARRTTLTAEEFYERLAATDASLPARLKAFLTELETLDVYADQRTMLTLKWRNEDGREFNLGVIDAQGRLFTDYCYSAADAIGRIDVIHRYKSALAKLVPGARVEPTDKAMGVRLVIPNQTNTLSRLLDHAPEWLKAIGDCVLDLHAATDAA